MSNIDKKLEAIKYVRENGIPFLGICFGHQLVCIEWARNVMGIKDAASEEFGKGTLVVKKRKEGLNVGIKKIGDRYESFWNNYEVREDIEKNFKEHCPPTMLTSQFHPEYESSKENPHPLLLKFIEIICKKIIR